MPKPGLSQHLIDQIILHSDGVKTAREISELIGNISEESVRKYQIIYNCPRSTRTGMRRGPGHPGWNSGRKLDRDGYVLISCGPEHPHIRKVSGRIVGLILEHRIIMEIKIGRFLEPNEVVDHIDGCRIHNHPDNLRLFDSNAEHLKETISGKIPQWSKEGKQKISLARWHGEKMNEQFPELINTYQTMKESGDLRLQQIRLAHELLDSQSIWFLGMRRYFETLQIDWPFDQTKESCLLKQYLQMISDHPAIAQTLMG
jgi:hypothetical protein